VEKSVFLSSEKSKSEWWNSNYSYCNSYSNWESILISITSIEKQRYSNSNKIAIPIFNNFMPWYLRRSHTILCRCFRMSIPSWFYVGSAQCAWLHQYSVKTAPNRLSASTVLKREQLLQPIGKGQPFVRWAVAMRSRVGGGGGEQVQTCTLSCRHTSRFLCLRHWGFEHSRVLKSVLFSWIVKRIQCKHYNKLQ